ncbi:hypothetical protein [Phosphitispora fastidiosa]|uniref:hypothetical protein n=1 Tax=Phosphitispora fastidiosa TaxID=2837202 RepID=UPI001E36C080|nr:hypothetical protein [Phosphitispora fastidiosa]MBU7005369.1 hypothetical protein [Phosphitispora fastidiosa]
MLKKKSRVIAILFVFALLIILLPGCGTGDKPAADSSGFLKNDARKSLQSAYAEDYTRISIIRGALNKYIVNPDNPKYLGTVMGALEAAVFPEEYELKRFTQLENISAEMRKEIISQPMLDITVQTRIVLNHIYSAVIKPLSDSLDKGNPITTEELQIINAAAQQLDSLAQGYSVLSNDGVDFNSSEAQRSFISLQNSLNELQKLELVKLRENEL